jgi:hypothetical protein
VNSLKPVSPFGSLSRMFDPDSAGTAIRGMNDVDTPFQDHGAPAAHHVNFAKANVYTAETNSTAGEAYTFPNLTPGTPGTFYRPQGYLPPPDTGE